MRNIVFNFQILDIIENIFMNIQLKIIVRIFNKCKLQTLIKSYCGFTLNYFLNIHYQQHSLSLVFNFQVFCLRE